MSLEENKRLAIDFLANMASDPERTFAAMADDAIFSVAGRSSLSGNWTRDQMMGLLQGAQGLGDGPFTIVPVSVTAEEDRVAVEAKGHLKLKDGRTYENTYFILFQIRDGKFIAIREHSDTLYLQSMFPG